MANIYWWKGNEPRRRRGGPARPSTYIPDFPKVETNLKSF